VNNAKNHAKYAAFMGIALALTAVLSYADSLFSAALPVAGIRLGLANIVIITVMLRFGAASGLLMSVLRSGFVFITRGMTAAVMSASGGLLSFAASAILLLLLKRSCKFSCIIAALCHTLGQIVAACMLTGSIGTLYYAVLLAPVSIAAGYLTGTVIQALKIERFKDGKVDK